MKGYGVSSRSFFRRGSSPLWSACHVTADYPLTETPATGVFKSMDAGETWSVTGLIGYHCDCSIGGTSSHGTTLAPQANRALRMFPKCPILVGRQGLEPWTR